MKITRRMLRRWGACYTDEKIAALVPEDGLTPLEVADLDNIPVEDRLWVLLREELITARDLRLLACDWAEGACRAAGWDDPRSLEAIAVARRFADGEATEAELAAAWSAAARAARSAWEAAAAEAWAWSARSARESVRESAWWSAECASADSAEARSEQLADVVRVLKRINEAAKAGEDAE